MKEKDLEKCLDNIIIKGLIQEAEQDNAEFEAAMRNMSNEDFLALIYDTVKEPTTSGVLLEKNILFDREDPVLMSSNIEFSVCNGFAGNSADEWDFELPSPQSVEEKSKTRQKGWKICASAIASVAAILLIVLIPVNRDLNSRICESALLASTAFQGPTRGIDIASMSKEEVNEMLHELEMGYSASKHTDNDIRYEKAQDNDSPAYYIGNTDSEEAGMDLVQAYLKLNRKDDAIIVLKELAESEADQEFKEYCKKMLEILE